MPRRDDDENDDDGRILPPRELPPGWSEDDLPAGWREAPTPPGRPDPYQAGTDPLTALWEGLFGPIQRRTDDPVDPEIAIIEDRFGERRVHSAGMPVWDGGSGSGSGSGRRLPPRPSGRSWLPLTQPGSDRRYYLGDEYKPAAGDPATIADLQDDLERAGLLPAGAYRRGVWDVQSASGYAMVLRRANVRGVTADEELVYLGEHPMFDPEDRTVLSAIFEQIERTRAAVSRPSSG